MKIKRKQAICPLETHWGTAEISRAYGVSTACVVGWIKKGLIKTYKKLPGSADYRIPDSALKRFDMEHSNIVPTTKRKEAEDECAESI